jgi:hypothetical protein
MEDGRLADNPALTLGESALIFVTIQNRKDRVAKITGETVNG